MLKGQENVVYLLLICTISLEKKYLVVMEDHTFHNKSYDNVGVDSYLQPMGA